MEAVRALTWPYNDQERERDRLYGYAILTETELLTFALTSKHAEGINRHRHKDLPQSQVDLILKKLELGKAKKTHRFQRSEIKAIGYIKAAAKLRVETTERVHDLGGFPPESDLAYLATELATTAFPKAQPRSEKVAATLAVQGLHLKTIALVAAAALFVVVLAIIGGQDDFDSSARDGTRTALLSRLAGMLGDIPLPALLICCAAALAYPIFLMVRQARRGYTLLVWSALTS